MIKNLPANAGDTRDADSIPESGRSLGVGNGNSSILAWEIPWTEEPSELPTMGSQKSATTEHTCMCTQKEAV